MDIASIVPINIGPGGWGGDWYVWHAPEVLRARAATALGCMQAGTDKLGVIEACYASAIIGVERRLALDKPVARSRQGITATRAADFQSLRKASRPLRHDPCISKVVADEQVVVGHLAGRGAETGT